MSNTRKPRNTKRQPAAIDFDKIKKKKQSAIGQIPPIKVGGKNRTLPPFLPMSITEQFVEGSTTSADGKDISIMLSDMVRMLSDTFGEEQWADIKKHIDISDVPELFETVFDIYGETVGEASNSGES